MDTSLSQEIIITAISELAPLVRNLASLDTAKLAGNLTDRINVNIQERARNLHTFLSALQIPLTSVEDIKANVQRIANTLSLTEEYTAIMEPLIDASKVDIAELIENYKEDIADLEKFIAYLSGIEPSTLEGLMADSIKKNIDKGITTLREALSVENIDMILNHISSERGREICDAILLPIIDSQGEDFKRGMASLFFFYKHKSKLAVGAGVGLTVGLTGGTYCALILAGVITGAAAMSTALAIAGLTIAAMLILAGAAALVLNLLNPINRFLESMNSGLLNVSGSLHSCMAR